MTEKIVLFSTCPAEEEAARIARSLVDEGLAACVSVVPRLRSYYRWKGGVESADEFLLIIKSSRELIPALSAALRKSHSYEVPELIALPIVGGLPEYLTWLDESLQQEGGPR